MSRTLSLKALAASFALIAVGLVAAPAHAQLFQFASYIGTSQNNFRYDNATNTVFSTANGTTAGSVPVNFVYRQTTAAGAAFTTIPATLSFSATGAAAVGGTSTLALSNVLLTITAVTAPNAALGTTLLQITTGSTGLLDGTVGSTVSSISGDTGATTPQVVTFSSPYLNFGASTRRVFSFTTTNTSPSYTIAGNNRPNSFNGSYDGNFSSDPAPTSVTVVPEANAGVLAMLALPVIGAIVSRRRNK